ncbi:MAG: phage scaffolding protein [Faecalibacterium sp.]|nr:phage scaffolding protein [Faecalibacterium sp.]
MKREDIKTILPDISDEALGKIMDLHGADIEKQKSTIATLTTQRDDYKTRLDEADGKLAGYDPEWKAKAEQAQKDADARVTALERDYAATAAISGLKFTSEGAKKAFLADLKAKNLPLQDGKLLGFEDFIKAYKEADAASFAGDAPAPGLVIPGKTRPPQTNAQQVLDAKYKNNPFYTPKGD